MPTSLVDKKIIISGASGGIGGTIALFLAKKGARIFALGRDNKKLRQLKKEIVSRGGYCRTFAFDITKRGARNDFLRKIEALAGSIDWLINSIGYLGNDRTENIHDTLTVNLESLIEITETLIPFLTREGGVINISSTASLNPNSCFPVYSASKAGVNIYTLAKANGAARGISFFTVCPGPTNTPMRQKIDPQANLRQGPMAVAGVIKKIITNESKYRNGDIIIVRNGKESVLKSRNLKSKLVRAWPKN